MDIAKRLRRAPLASASNGTQAAAAAATKSCANCPNTTVWFCVRGRDVCGACGKPYVPPAPPVAAATVAPVVAKPLTPTGPRVALGNITNSAVSSPTANTKTVPSAQKPPRTPAAKRSLVLAAPKSTSAASAASAVPTPTLATPEPLIMKATRRGFYIDGRAVLVAVRGQPTATHEMGLSLTTAFGNGEPSVEHHTFTSANLASIANYHIEGIGAMAASRRRRRRSSVGASATPASASRKDSSRRISFSSRASASPQAADSHMAITSPSARRPAPRRLSQQGSGGASPSPAELQATVSRLRSEAATARTARRVAEDGVAQANKELARVVESIRVASSEAAKRAQVAAQQLEATEEAQDTAQAELSKLQQECQEVQASSNAMRTDAEQALAQARTRVDALLIDAQVTAERIVADANDKSAAIADAAKAAASEAAARVRTQAATSVASQVAALTTAAEVEAGRLKAEAAAVLADAQRQAAAMVEQAKTGVDEAIEARIAAAVEQAVAEVKATVVPGAVYTEEDMATARKEASESAVAQLQTRHQAETELFVKELETVNEALTQSQGETARLQEQVKAYDSMIGEFEATCDKAVGEKEAALAKQAAKAALVEEQLQAAYAKAAHLQDKLAGAQTAVETATAEGQQAVSLERAKVSAAEAKATTAAEELGLVKQQLELERKEVARQKAKVERTVAAAQQKLNDAKAAHDAQHVKLVKLASDLQGSQAAFQELQARTKALQRQGIKMKEEAAAATARCGHLTTERDALVSSLEEAKAQSASLQSKLASMTTQREALAGRVAAAAQELQDAKTAAQSELATKTGALEAQLKEYKLKLFDLQEALEKATAAAGASSSDSGAVAELQKQLAAVTAERDEALATKAELEKLSTELLEMVEKK